MIFGEKVFFHYSKQKLSIIQRLVSKNVYKATLDYLKMLEQSVSNSENLNVPNGNLRLKPTNKYDRIFSEQYIEYLSRYNSNLVSFSNTNFIEAEASQQVFETIFRKLIDDSPIEVTNNQKQKNLLIMRGKMA